MPGFILLGTPIKSLGYSPLGHLAIRLPQSGTWGLACSLQRSGFRKTARLRNCSIGRTVPFSFCHECNRCAARERRGAVAAKPVPGQRPATSP